MPEIVTIQISDGEDEGDICSICHLGDNVKRQCQCNAYFHPECWDKWLEVSSEKRCPCCRIEIVKVGEVDKVDRVDRLDRRAYVLIVIVWYPLLILIGYLLNGCEDLSNKSFVELLDRSVKYLGKGVIFSLIVVFIYWLKKLASILQTS